MFSKISIENFKCVICGDSLVEKNDTKLYCNNEKCAKHIIPFNIVQNKAVLIDFNRSLLSENHLISLAGKSSVNRINQGLIMNFRNKLRRKNVIVESNIELLIKEVEKSNNPKILVVGGGEIGNGLDNFYIKYRNVISSFDIYCSPHIDFIADAHQIPIVDEYFDVVIVQAVLEHVLVPTDVVSEIWRVLKFNGIVYAETPFMQQVHEGQYDFLRFTESGHRYLFKNFELIKSGYLLGAATTLLWSLDYFFSGLFRSRFIGKLIRIFFFWLPYFDNLIPEKFNIDGASGVFFMGKKSNNTISAIDIIRHYKGNQI